MRECAICHRTENEVKIAYRTESNMYLCSKHRNQLIRHGRITDGERDSITCEICGKKNAETKVQWCSEANKYLCLKHVDQYKRLGRFLEKTKRDPNRIAMFEDHAEILLENSNGEVVGAALVDLDDVDKCSSHRWYITEPMGNTQYVKSAINGVNTGLHRFVMEASGRDIVDHINRNGLDNRKANLRIVSCSENCVNSKTRSATKEKNIYQKGDTYQVQIVRNYKPVYVKSFNSLHDAVIARDKFLEIYNKENNRQV